MKSPERSACHRPLDPEPWQQRVNAALERWLPHDQPQASRLQRAMRYSVLGGGKRVRPLLVYFAGTALGADPASLDGPAVAVECVHSYSLVHDDLPAMDDDDLRRGRPSCHVAFDEATAILAGDALQMLAVQVLADDPAMQASPERRLAMISLLGTASGIAGMAGGQAMDLDAAGKQADREYLKRMHQMKTGALIRASVLLGAMGAAELSANDQQCLEEYGACVGLAFQIRDDVLDQEGELELIGKRPGQDQARAKPTYPAVIGLSAALEEADALHRRAIEALDGFSGDPAGLVALSDYLLDRDH